MHLKEKERILIQGTAKKGYTHAVFMGLRGDWKTETKERPTNNKTHTHTIIFVSVQFYV